MAKPRRGLIICCSITVGLIIILLVASLIVYFTVLKPKQPKITTKSVTLDYIKWVPPLLLNVTLGVTVTIDNRNYGSFKYENSTAFLTYHGVNVAEAPIVHDTIPARSKHDISTIVVIVADKLIPVTGFIPDVISGWLNFTSSTTLQGKAKVLKLLKVKATSYSTCDISVNIPNQNATSVCNSKVKV